MKEMFFLVEEAIERGYNARAIGESIYTEGDSIDDLKVNIRDAVQCHFDEPADYISAYIINLAIFNRQGNLFKFLKV